MGARQKLNVAFVNGSVLLAGVLGLVTQSWLVFGLALALLLAGNVCLRQIRPFRSDRRGPTD